jgi:hypothetical protein
LLAADTCAVAFARRLAAGFARDGCRRLDAGRAGFRGRWVAVFFAPGFVRFAFILDFFIVYPLSSPA